MPVFPRGATRRQSGQALPLVLVFMLVLCIGALITFNTGQVVNKKVELTNAADAAAYSVAVEQARAWNLAAYLNRGRVANEVAIAQVVSINSWLTQINVSAFVFKTVAELLSWIPGVVAVAEAFEAADQALRGLRSVVRGLSGPAIAVLDTANFAYANIARAVIEGASAASAVQIANKVAEENSPGADMRALATGELIVGLKRARDTYLDEHQVPRGNRTTSGGNRYRNVVMESRDGFTRDRRDDWLVLVANGGTDMVAYDRWAGVDTNEINISLFFERIRIPVGWAGAQALRGSSQPRFFPGINNGRGWYSDERRRTLPAYNGVSPRGIAGRFVESDPGGRLVGGNKRDAYFGTYQHGLAQPYHDLRARYAQSSAEGADAGPIFTVELQAPLAAARTSTETGMGTGRMAMREQAPGDHIRAVASSQVYFNRPHDYAPFRRMVWGRSDNRFEMGSLFSPYWQARLVDTPGGTRARLGAVR